MRLRLLLVTLGLSAWLGAFASTAFAHVSPDSQVTLHMRDRHVVAEIIIPASEYAYASGNVASNDAGALEQARSYLADRAAVTGLSGQVWNERIENLRFATVAGPRDLLATMIFIAPPEAASEPFLLNWSPVLDETADHFATILVDRFGDGRSPELVGMLRQGDTRIKVAYAEAGFAMRFGSAMRLGIDHILGGLDHLAFLAALLLAAPLIARNGRWASVRDKRGSLRSLVIVATGFTIGHSLTLVGVASSGLTLPSSLVEPAIAFTVLITAAHAIRPLFAGRELVVAVFFGLIHGLGFAGFIQQTEAELGRSIATLAGFNVGIEIVQVALLALFVPVLFWLESRSAYKPVRLVLAAVIAAASVYWIVSRVGILPA
ncbi:HupE/UreJ family protein [Qipengyuania sp. G39]|uniref:HupE/UreJ family protein n=1 Tax=Qipengyuania profundimaris TaxID=3067652 RepID=A0ABT9HNH7_9SPHN|nr:HupE/UreJ family protein [Qipengyuania sp. G39]MDP4574412.1 HupE/UreJ family protein [Qipengyuania sp. G39]